MIAICKLLAIPSPPSFCLLPPLSSFLPLLPLHAVRFLSRMGCFNGIFMGLQTHMGPSCMHRHAAPLSASTLQVYIHSPPAFAQSPPLIPVCRWSLGMVRGLRLGWSVLPCSRRSTSTCVEHVEHAWLREDVLVLRLCARVGGRAGWCPARK